MHTFQNRSWLLCRTCCSSSSVNLVYEDIFKKNIPEGIWYYLWQFGQVAHFSLSKIWIQKKFRMSLCKEASWTDVWLKAAFTLESRAVMKVCHGKHHKVNFRWGNSMGCLKFLILIFKKKVVKLVPPCRLSQCFGCKTEDCFFYTLWSFTWSLNLLSGK